MVSQQDADVLISEGNQAWRPLPPWVQFLLRLGYEWPSSPATFRRIALMSLPCDSAAAALITLGALVRDLGNQNANDLGAHYEALFRFAEQYVQWCSKCDMRCDPELKGCGYLSQASGAVRRNGDHYEIAGISRNPRWGEAITCVNKRETRLLLKEYSFDWHIEGQPPLQSRMGELSLTGSLYSRLVAGANIIAENLLRSYGGLCLATRVGGEAATREICGSIQFRIGGADHHLDRLLSVHGWTEPHAVSRVTLFNARTDRFDRYPYAPSLVLADGDVSFLRILGRDAFQRSDVIGVMHRTLDRERLELVGNRMMELRQWYDEDRELLGRFAAVPRGIALTVLRQRVI
jgi:hypothetical protein